MFSLFKSRTFWIIWFIACIIGMILGIVLPMIEESKIKGGKYCATELFGDKNEVIFIGDDANKNDYLDQMKSPGLPKSWNYSFGIGKPGKKIWVVDTIYDGDLIEFVSRYPKFPKASGDTTTKLEYHWIYKSYVQCK